jgi:hypothetical protein
MLEHRFFNKLLRSAVNDHSTHIGQMQECRAPDFVSRLFTKPLIIQIARSRRLGVNKNFKAPTKGLTSGGRKTDV